MPHLDHNLKAIIFAYSGLYKAKKFTQSKKYDIRKKYSLLNRQSWKICHSYLYIISLIQKDLIRILFDACRNNRPDTLTICLKNPLAKYIEPRRFSESLPKALMSDSEKIGIMNQSILQYCCLNEYMEIMRLLLESRFKINLYTCIESLYLTENQQISLINLLLENPHIAVDKRFYGKILIDASKNGNLKLMRLLTSPSLYNGYSDKDMRNALFYSLCGYKHYHTASLLLYHPKINHYLSSGEQKDYQLELARLVGSKMIEKVSISRE